MVYHAGAWEPGKYDHLNCVNQEMKNTGNAYHFVMFTKGYRKMVGLFSFPMAGDVFSFAAVHLGKGGI